VSFASFAARKTRDAAAAAIEPLVTTAAGPLARTWRSVGNEWTRLKYDGGFHLAELPRGRPAVSLVFVESQDGNTVATNPAELGGGAADLHFIYEGLSRVAADGVLAGAGTVTGRNVFFSVWHPELVALRTSLGLRRHPAQLVVSDDGRIDLGGTLLFNVPEVPTFVLAGPRCRRVCHDAFRKRPWITVVPFDRNDWVGALRRLHAAGLSRLSVVGGRATATSLVDADVVQDLCLTTTSRVAGQPGTPWYEGRQLPRCERIVQKHATGDGGPIRIEHLAFT
jgi:5-amino-6-(5-phosphoribosylamino)uracil reductase